MQLQIKAVYEGLNPFARSAVLVCDAQAEDEEWRAVGGGLVKLGLQWPQWFGALQGLPGLQQSAEPTAVAQAWAEGTKTLLNAVRGCLQDAGASLLKGGVVRLWVGYHNAPLAVQGLKLVLALALASGSKTPTPEQITRDEARIKALLQQTRRQHPDYQIRYVMLAARERNVPVLPLVAAARVWQAGWGRRQRLFFESTPSEDSMIGGMLARDKVLSKQFLTALGAPVGPHVLVNSAAELAEAAQVVGWPCVVKPLNLGGGKGVTADLRTPEALESAFAYARKFTAGPVMVERHLPGDDHRLLVVNGSLVWAVRRQAAAVVGDGIKTMRQLIDELNLERRFLQEGNQHLVPVVEDDVFRRHLSGQGLTVDSVPAPGQRVTMRSVSNLSMGGELLFVTDRVHPSVRAMAESISAASGLTTIGLDYMTTDIAAAWQDTSAAFIEFNVTPGLDGVELHPGGEPLRLLGDVLLGEQVGRIPVLCLWMTQAHWLQYRPQLHSWMQKQAQDWGGSGPGWVWANGAAWQADGVPAHEAATKLLHHRSVGRAVMVLVSEEVVRSGVPVDGVDTLLVMHEAVPAGWQGVAQGMARKMKAVSGLQSLHEHVMQWSKQKIKHLDEHLQKNQNCDQRP